MDWSEEDQKVAVSAAGAMSLKRSFSSLDLAADARAARARRSALRRRAQPSNKEGLEDPTLETPLKDTGLPPSPPAPPIDGRTLSDLEVLRTIETIKYDLGMDSLGMDTLAQLLADKTTTDKTTTDKGFNDLGPVALPRIGKEERKEALEEFRKGKGKSGGARGEGASDKRAVALEARERLGLPPAEGSENYDTAYWKQKGCNLHLDLNDEDALAAKGLPNDGSNRSESFLYARSEAYWYGKFSASEDPGSMLARGGQTKGVASASSDVAGASNARAENSDDAREPPAAARGFSDQALLLDGCCHRIRPYPWNPSYDPPPPSEALQAVESSDRRPSSRRSRSPRARRSRPSEM